MPVIVRLTYDRVQTVPIADSPTPGSRRPLRDALDALARQHTGVVTACGHLERPDDDTRFGRAWAFDSHADAQAFAAAAEALDRSVAQATGATPTACDITFRDLDARMIYTAIQETGGTIDDHASIADRDKPAHRTVRAVFPTTRAQARFQARATDKIKAFTPQLDTRP